MQFYFYKAEKDSFICIMAYGREEADEKLKKRFPDLPPEQAEFAFRTPVPKAVGIVQFRKGR